MDDFVGRYLVYIETVRRYSPRTVQIYSDVLERYFYFFGDVQGTDALVPQLIRTYEVHLLDDLKESPRTVALHMSVLSGLCRYLVKEGKLKSNPVRLVKRPKVSKRLPEVYKEDAMQQYFGQSQTEASEQMLDLLEAEIQACGITKYAVRLYEERLRRLVVSLLSATGIRRSELISLTAGAADLRRRVLTVRGKGDKTRTVPLVPEVCDELSMYLRSRELMNLPAANDGPLLVTTKGASLYPVFVDRTVKAELGTVPGITGRKSPHVLRHTIATELLDEGTDLNSIKEMLGHSSLAATQVYTHNSIAKLRSVYAAAHPRAGKKD